MREILFRGQTRRYGEKVRIGDGKKSPSHWVYGGVLQGAGYHSIIYGGESIEEPDENFGKWCVYTDTLGQYTGLTDKNGNRIFEGDVVLYPWNYQDKPERFTIKFKDGQFVASPVKENEDYWDFMVGGYSKEMEIIGNIHDNPELLEV